MSGTHERTSLLSGHRSPQITAASSWVVNYKSLHIALLVSTGSDTGWIIMDAQEIWMSLLTPRPRASILREPHMSFRSLKRMTHCCVCCPYGLQMGNTHATTLILLWFLDSSYGSQKIHIIAFVLHALHLLGHRILEIRSS